jgi:exodeoxyribonuclease VII small subunit
MQGRGNSQGEFVMKGSKKSFEQAIEELGEIVAKLEDGEIALEESIEYFQRGVELSKFCNRKLDEAERKITMLLDNGGDELQETVIPGVDTEEK